MKSALKQYLAVESPRFLQADIYWRVFPRSFWIGLTKRDWFPENNGHELHLSTLLNKGTIVSISRTWHLQSYHFQSKPFCVEVLRTKEALHAKLEEVMEVFSDQARIILESRYRSEFIRLSDRKVVLSAAIGSANFPHKAATRSVTQGFLSRQKKFLIRNGAGESAFGWEEVKGEKQPILTIVVSGEASERIIQKNKNIRHEIRYGRPVEPLPGYGVERSYSGFYHLIDYFPERYNFTADGGYEVVQPIVTTGQGGNKKPVINRAWLDAIYEGGQFYDQTVFTSRVLRPITKPGVGFKLDPSSYFGEFRFVFKGNGMMATPDAVLSNGSEPVHTERGLAWIGLRPDMEKIYTQRVKSKRLSSKS